jgi:hypothetical protein
MLRLVVGVMPFEFEYPFGAQAARSASIRPRNTRAFDFIFPPKFVQEKHGYIKHVQDLWTIKPCYSLGN